MEDGREIFDDDLNEDPTVSKGSKFGYSPCKIPVLLFICEMSRCYIKDF